MKLLNVSAFLAMAALCPAQNSPWEKEIVYQIFPRSYCDSNGDHVGDFRGVTEKLGFIHDLGFTSVLINPIFSSRLYHNYFADDFFKADPKLGTNKEFFELVRKAHARRMKVILDMEVQYIGDLHPWYLGLKDPKSPYADFIWLNGSKLFGEKLPGYDGKLVGYATLNPDNKQIRSKITDIFRYWAAPDGDPTHGVDGFRIDHMMDDLDFQHVKTGMLTNFWLPIEQSIRKLNPKIFFLAEQGDWGLGTDVFAKGGVDAVYAIPLWKAWLSFDKYTIEKTIAATEFNTPNGKTHFVFIENHDVKRYASVVNSNPDLLRLGAVFNLTYKGTPLVYYGQELGQTGIQGQWNSDGNDIPVRLAYRWTRKVEGKGSADFYRNTGPWAQTGYQKDDDGVSVEEEVRKPDSLFNFYKRLTHLRASHPALQSGSIRMVVTDNPGVLTYDRVLGRQRIRICMNLSKVSQDVVLPPGRDLIAGGRKKGPANIKPHGFLILDASN